MQTVANVLDFVVAVITITIQYTYVDFIMCWWCTLCVVCVRACMHAMCKTLCQQFGEIDLSRII